MPGRSQRPQGTAVEQQRSNEEDDGLFGWGNDLFSSWFGGGSDTELDDTGTFDESMYDMGTQLGNTGVGTVNDFQGSKEGTQQTDMFQSFGIGGGMDGGLGPLNMGMGGGIGGTYEQWNSSTTNGDGVSRDVQGHTLGVGAMGRVDQSVDAFGQHVGGGGEVYRGV
ncbi:MAG: hypothetical protein HN348_34800, partial [Proteobacteria bacterium]|nr:hypothetical protein [Pseudomonadota bacterium]